MNEDADEERAEAKAREALEEACERSPTEHPWGYYHNVAGSPAADVVQPGVEIMALPLRLEGVSGSPFRVVVSMGRTKLE